MLGMEYDGPVGYMPVQLGQVLEDFEGSKYEIVRKLGWGSNASAWLSKQLRCVSRERATLVFNQARGRAVAREDSGPASGRYVAIKILTVSNTRGIELGDLYELEVWRRFHELRNKYEGSPPPHLGHMFCVEPLTAFTADSKHGTHVCFVTKPFGSTIDELQLAQPGLTLPLPVVKLVVKQTLVALHFLHTEIGIVHADVKAGNLLIDLSASQEAIDTYLKDNPSETYPERLSPELWSGPIVTVKSQPLPNMGLHPSLDNLKVSLGDFGGSVPIDKVTPDTRIFTPKLLRPPEMLLDHEWSTPADIWAVGCMVFECLTGASLFQVQRTPKHDPVSLHLGRMVEHLGPVPADFLNGCRSRSQFFDESGTLLDVPPPLPGGGPLESWFGGFLHIRETLSEDDVKATCAFLRRCLAIDPSARASAAELLSGKWFNN
ncbi:kinase-like domain-containing protein [Daedaleopsis nitida]|nr:kinase-like domain-containing protein [Daedaleopsis nitida]